MPYGIKQWETIFESAINGFDRTWDLYEIWNGERFYYFGYLEQCIKEVLRNPKNKIIFKLKYMQQPTIGRIVHFFANEKDGNLSRKIKRVADQGVAPAIIVKINDGSATLNVFIDDAESPVVCMRNVPNKENSTISESYWDWPSIK